MKIAFVYSAGRVERRARVETGEAPSEFLYGAMEFKAVGDEVDFLEFPAPQEGKLPGFLDRAFHFAMPARTRSGELLGARALAGHLNSYDCVVATYAQAALSLGLWKNLGRLKTPLVAIQCGLVNYSLKGTRRESTSWLLRPSRIVLFADAERRAMIDRYRVPRDRIVDGRFGVDIDFWKAEDGVEREGYLLAVGNDGRRDFETLLRAAGSIPAEIFILTRRELPAALPKNVKVIEGDLDEGVSDKELRDLYRRASGVLIPLTDSLQPSGQSVALQAICCGTPVVMTRTIGNWAAGLLENKKHLIHCKMRSAADLAAAAKWILSEPVQALSMAKDAREVLVEKDVTIGGFASRLRAVCEAATGAQDPLRTGNQRR